MAPLLGVAVTPEEEALAQAEMACMLRLVVERWPSLRLGGSEPLRWHQRGTFRGLDELLVSAN